MIESLQGPCEAHKSCGHGHGNIERRGHGSGSIGTQNDEDDNSTRFAVVALTHPKTTTIFS